MDTLKCLRHSQFKDDFGSPHYYVCGKDANFKVSFLDNTATTKTECLCKMHFNALKKNCERIQKITGYDSQLKYESI